jgi:hypothetical protein
MAHSDLNVYELCMLMHSHTMGAPYGSLRLKCIWAVHANAQSYPYAERASANSDLVDLVDAGMPEGTLRL